MPREARWRLMACAALLVLCFRALYLWRFGWDAFWMNQNFLVEARGLALGAPGEAHGLPGTPLLLWLARSCGLSPLGAVGLSYLLGHLLFALATLRLAFVLWPTMSVRRFWCLALLLATLPMLAGQQGYKNVAVLLGAGLAVAALTLALVAAESERRSARSLLMVMALAALGGFFRHEAAGVTLAGAAMLAVLGRTLGGLRRPGEAALALGLGAGLGFALVIGARALWWGTTELNLGAYAYYTFYDGLPALMWPTDMRVSEHGRYLASMEIFGSYASNDGSLLKALLGHPLDAALRVLAKPIDVLGVMAWLEGITPLGFFAALWGLRGLRGLKVVRGSAMGQGTAMGQGSRGWMLLPFSGAFLVLCAAPASANYCIAFLPPILLAMARGVELLVASAGPRLLRVVAAGGLVAGGVFVALWGKTEATSRPAINLAAVYLEERCGGGCLVNALPLALTSQLWVELGSGAPLPVKTVRSEDFVLKRHTPAFVAECRFSERVARARAAGHRGPVLYVQSKPVRETATLEDDDPDVEGRFEGPVALGGATVEARFGSGSDEVVVYSFPR